MMRTKWFLIGAFAVLALAGRSRAQWVPVNGEQTTTIQVTSRDGKRVSYEQRKEQYFRHSNGSVLIQRTADDGSNLPVSAILIDSGKTGRSFKIDYATSAAVDRHRPAPADIPRTREFLKAMKPGNRPPEETVNGIPCIVKPVILVNPDGTRTTIGKVWLAPDYNYLAVKEDTIHPLSGGGSMHILRELHDLAAGSEQDAALFAKDHEAIKRARTLANPRKRH